MTTKYTLIVAIILLPLFMSAQNLVTNSAFNNGSTGWANSCSVEVYAETVYGGSNAANNVTEIDAERCLDQNINIVPGVTYVLTFKASRRIDAATPNNPGIAIKVRGVTTNFNYVNQTRSYNNTTFSWATQTYTFSVPANSSDNQVNLHIADNNGHSTYGVIVDDVEMQKLRALPVSFTSFTGIIKDNKAALTWLTVNEVNNSFFVIERSVNGRNYDSVGRVKAGSNAANTYAFSENNTNATSYYRVKQVDINGAYTYSSVIMLKNTGNTALTVYPTQAASTINYALLCETPAAVTVQIINLAGQPVISQQGTLQAGLNVQSVVVATLPKGSYMLRIQIPAAGVNLVKQFNKM